MSHERYTRTNQKLFYAGLALESWQEAEKASSFNAPARIQASREEALFHLYGAVLGLCHEIAGYYRLPDDALPTVEALLAPARLQASPSPEMAELVELAQNGETWLAKLLSAHATLYKPPVAPVQPKQDPTLPLIQAVNVGDESRDVQPLDALEIEAWRQRIKALALRFREGLSEI
ncbi:DUF6586 family protein [Pseudomonas matsuisoli]|uniref:PasA protein n=1 Tax=Pseudomonas matsuisoli TaxID=1515666 RepID=A0A917PJI4_9PSED|nr:DUF6586 family protein [Pseudomonas matsuisoli]GGJ81366.1 hypothetical protein GCM10009304_04050 [Pseudomonas matsuisoli]